ncbi:MAG: FAD-dependent monooxygenase [Betaproteobacteria bacterium]|nr:FAD-dependent monooxygenase [Betaproteobacteria bacterium]
MRGLRAGIRAEGGGGGFVVVGQRRARAVRPRAGTGDPSRHAGGRRTRGAPVGLRQDLVAVQEGRHTGRACALRHAPGAAASHPDRRPRAPLARHHPPERPMHGLYPGREWRAHRLRRRRFRLGRCADRRRRSAFQGAGDHVRRHARTLHQGPGLRGLVPMERLKPHHRNPTVATWVGPTAHVSAYPARWQDQDLMTFSGQVERSDWELESWNEKGTVEECLKDFAGWHADILEIIEHTESLHKWGLFVRDALPRWTTGRVSLLGDACHSMVPYLGQGVNMAIEDGCVLARCIEAAPRDPAGALQRYEQARLARTTRVASSAAGMQTIFHNPALADPATASAYVDSQWSPQKSRERYDWIYDYDATSVAI